MALCGSNDKTAGSKAKHARGQGKRAKRVKLTPCPFPAESGRTCSMVPVHRRVYIHTLAPELLDCRQKLSWFVDSSLSHHTALRTKVTAPVVAFLAEKKAVCRFILSLNFTVGNRWIRLLMLHRQAFGTLREGIHTQSSTIPLLLVCASARASSMRLSDTAFKNWVMRRIGALGGSPWSFASAIGAKPSWDMSLGRDTAEVKWASLNSPTLRIAVGYDLSICMWKDRGVASTTDPTCDTCERGRKGGNKNTEAHQKAPVRLMGPS